MRRETISFTNESGQQLAARLERPDGNAPCHHLALFAHCFTCSKDIAAASRISRALVEQGLGVLRFDFTGLGNSEGDFANTNFSSNVQDLVSAANHLRSTHKAPALLVGHSLGGAAVLAAADQIPEAKGVITIGAPSTPKHVEHLLTGKLEEIQTQGEAEVKLAGRTFTIKRQFLEDLAEQRMSEKIRALGKALLILHSPIDAVVHIDEARRIYQLALHPKSFISLDDADHLLSRPADARYVGQMIAAWAARYLPEPERPEAEDAAQVVVQTASGKFTQTVHAGRHHFLADEPKRYKGDDLGPSPYDLLLAGLGACTSMTMKMYAERKGWPLQSARVTLSHDRIHAKDCEDCEEREGQIERISRKIQLEGPLDEAQRKRLMEIADRCPVHRTLRSHPHIRTVEEPSE